MCSLVMGMSVTLRKSTAVGSKPGSAEAASAGEVVSAAIATAAAQPIPFTSPVPSTA
jgi:hypothetical protein